MDGGWGENRINHSSFSVFVFENSVSGKDRGYGLIKVPSNAFFQQKLLRMCTVIKLLKMDMWWVAVRVLETHVRNIVTWFPVSQEVVSKGRSNFLKETIPITLGCIIIANFFKVTILIILLLSPCFSFPLSFIWAGVMWVVDFSYETYVIPMVMYLAGLWPERLNLQNLALC